MSNCIWVGNNICNVNNFKMLYAISILEADTFSP